MGVSVRGMRGAHSPMNSDRVPEVQKQAIRAEVDRLKHEARFMVEVRYSVYIGPGCAAERGDITVCVDGGIASMVTREGLVY